MAHTHNSIVIERPIEEVFDLSNDLEQWPKVFNEYVNVKILDRTVDRLVFRMTNKQNESWRSSRYIDRAHWLVTALREDPLYPFKHMALRWIYRPVDKGTEMVWEQFFEMDPASGVSNEIAVERVVKHSQVNMSNFKRWMETGSRDG
jgi:aromatase